MKWSYVPNLPYNRAWAWQRNLQRRLSEHPDITGYFLLTTHPPTLTCGRRTSPEELPFSVEEYARRGVAVVQSDRGGLATYHGPGQLVGYPVVRLSSVGAQGARALVEMLENVLEKTCDRCGVVTHRDLEHPGAWVENRKIGALGLRIRQGISMHGFSLNVNNDLDVYDWFTPCGIADRGVTTLLQCGSSCRMEEVLNHAIASLAEVFNVRLENDSLPGCPSMNEEDWIEHED